MSLGAFYGSVFSRAWGRSFDRARKFGFWVTIAAGILLFIARYFLPTSRPVNRVVEFAWTLPLAFLLLSFLWLLIREPYELYQEQTAALASAIQAKTSDITRSDSREKLSECLRTGQYILAAAKTDGIWLQEEQVRAWCTEVEEYLQTRLGTAYVVRFRHGADFTPYTFNDQKRGLPLLERRCDNLLELIKEHS